MSYSLNGQKEELRGYFHFKSFYDLVAKEAPQGATFVELGVFEGKSLIYLAQARPDLDIVGVDWGRGSAYTGRTAHYGTGKTANQLLNNLETYNLADRIPIVLFDSPKASRFFADKSVWCVFVDANHEKDGVERDLVAWAPKVSPGGLLAGDDYNSPGWPGVKQAVDELYPQALKMAPWTWLVRF